MRRFKLFIFMMDFIKLFSIVKRITNFLFMKDHIGLLIIILSFNVGDHSFVMNVKKTKNVVVWVCIQHLLIELYNDVCYNTLGQVCGSS